MRNSACEIQRALRWHWSQRGGRQAQLAAVGKEMRGHLKNLGFAFRSSGKTSEMDIFTAKVASVEKSEKLNPASSS